MKEETTIQTIGSARSGDLSRINLQEIFNEHYLDLYYYGLKLSGNVDITKDCIQDLFEQFWTNTDSLNHVQTVKAYLLKCLRRRIFYYLGKNGHVSSSSNIMSHLNPPSASAEEELIRNEEDSIIERKLDEARAELSPRQQEVLLLKYNMGYSSEMVCDIMNLKYQSVRNLLCEAIRVLRSKLGDSLPLS